MEKSQLSWNLNDYLKSGDEPPECVLQGKTEGEIMETGDIEVWAMDCIRFLAVFRDEYPSKYKTQQKYFKLDLDYLCSLGKITPEQRDNLAKQG